MKAVDCVIVGGSAGGLSAALCLGRSLRSTVVVDQGRPCNRFAAHSQNFLSRDGTPPSEIMGAGKQQIVDSYSSVEFQQGEVVSVRKLANDPPYLFQVLTTSSEQEPLRAKRLIFASGVTDVFPDDIPGFAECWGSSVIHCPYCHGFEFRNEPTAMFMDKDRAKHMVPLIRNLTPSITILLSSDDSFDKEDLDLFSQNGVSVETSPVKEIRHVEGKLTDVLLENGTTLPFTVIYAGIPLEINAKKILLDDLGCELHDDTGLVKVNDFQKTNVEGVLVVGDACTMFRSIANAVNGGNKAGAVVNAELSTEEFASRSTTENVVSSERKNKKDGTDASEEFA